MTDCDTCGNLVCDDESDEYVCDVYMDEDETARLWSDSRAHCPYWRSNDEYRTVMRQSFGGLLAKDEYDSRQGKSYFDTDAGNRSEISIRTTGIVNNSSRTNSRNGIGEDRGIDNITDTEEKNGIGETGAGKRQEP